MHRTSTAQPRLRRTIVLVNDTLPISTGEASSPRSAGAHEMLLTAMPRMSLVEIRRADNSCAVLANLIELLRSSYL